MEASSGLCERTGSISVVMNIFSLLALNLKLSVLNPKEPGIFVF
jgi:hypothetical protein